MTVDGHTMYFSYDAAGTPLSITFDGTEYFYTTNLQGDVTGIVDAAGQSVATYSYDAWGNYPEASAFAYNPVSTYNPLRYRGYVYDRETGLYYLQSRYYNPKLCRFINADNYPTTGQGFIGNNMFAYCGNNPVARIDPSGNCYYNSKGEWCHDNWEFIGGYERKPDPKHPYPTARDVTDEVCRALTTAKNDATRFCIATVLVYGNNKLSFAVICSHFREQVDHKAPWDIKLRNPWETTIETRYPGENATVFFLGKYMGIDKVGNFTYGYLGYTYGIPLYMLIPGSWYAAGFPTDGSDLDEEISDWPYIIWGYNYAKGLYE